MDSELTLLVSTAFSLGFASSWWLFGKPGGPVLNTVTTVLDFCVHDRILR